MWEKSAWTHLKKNATAHGYKKQEMLLNTWEEDVGLSCVPWAETGADLNPGRGHCRVPHEHSKAAGQGQPPHSAAMPNNHFNFSNL